MFLLLPFALLMVASPAHAVVFKCANDKGGVVYQDTACPPGKELRSLEDPVPQGTPRAPTPRVESTAAKPGRVSSGEITAGSGSAAERKYLQAGMSEAEVLRRVGRPDVERAAQGKEPRRWSYLPTAGDPDTLTTVTFSGDAVATVTRKVMR